MKLLVSKGADVNYCTLDYSGDNDENYPDVTDDDAENENDNDNEVNFFTLFNSDSSPLHLAVTKLHLEVVKVIKIIIIMTPILLCLAVTKLHLEVVKMLKI